MSTDLQLTPEGVQELTVSFNPAPIAKDFIEGSQN